MGYLSPAQTGTMDDLGLTVAEVGVKLYSAFLLLANDIITLEHF